MSYTFFTSLTWGAPLVEGALSIFLFLIYRLFVPARFPHIAMEREKGKKASSAKLYLAFGEVLD